MDVFGGGVPQVDAVYLSTGIQIMRHSWFGDIYVDGQARVGFDLIGVIGFSMESTPWRVQLPFGVDLAQFLFDFEQARAAGQSVSLQRWRHRKADGFVGA